MTRYTVLWLAVVDWEDPWQGQQALALRLAADGHTITFVETLGIRSPARRDWRRLVSRLRNRLRGGLWGLRALDENLWLFSPLVIPMPGRAWADRINHRILMRSLDRLLGERPLMVWTYLPTPAVVRLVRELRPERLVYYCTDDMLRNPAGVAPVMARAEDWLVRNADHVFATSRELCAERMAKSPRVTYLPDGADIEPFMESRPEPVDLARVPRPRICFFGTLDLRLNQELLVRVAAAFPAASVVLIGPVRCDVGRLGRLPNVYLLGPRPHELLPAYLHHMDLFIIPYLVNTYTASVHPVKTYEALATGKPLVAADLPELRPYAGPVVVARDDDEFLAGISAGLADSSAELREQRREIAQENTLDARYCIIRESVLGAGMSDLSPQEMPESR
jgi:glycosyltransferase involved in cell wall biosynthesis